MTAKVSLVATVRDARPHIEAFLASVRGQTRRPDEVVIVDGGSTDGTLEVLRADPSVQALSEPEANISRGRNAAIRAAAHDVLAVTDADCTLAPDWLERLLARMEDGVDVVAGFYRPVTPAAWQVYATAAIPEPEEVGPGRMPSSRSLAFRREAFEAAGGYPEWLAVGEDMYLNHRFVATGARMTHAPDAITYWRARESVGATWRQYVAYAEGDALAGMYSGRHALRFATYAGVAAAVASRNRWLLAALAAGAVAYARPQVRRARRRLPEGSPARMAALVGVPAAMAFIDAAKMWGYAKGLLSRSSPPPAATGPGASRRW